MVTTNHNVIVDQDPSLDGRIVARTYDSHWQSLSVYDENWKEGLANARLIAAAPDLLAACVRALQTAENWACYCEINGEGKNNPAAAAVNELKHAISKARGEA